MQVLLICLVGGAAYLGLAILAGRALKGRSAPLRREPAVQATEDQESLQGDIYLPADFAALGTAEQ